MPTLTPYRLTFRGGLHIGTRGVNLEEAGASLPSDTLFAALVDAWRHTGGDVDAFGRPFVASPPDPPFLLTSAFPYAGRVRFYPMPVDLARVFTRQTLADRGKRVKRVRYLSEELFRQALAGNKLDDWLFPESEYADPETGVALQGGSLWLTADEIAALPESMRLLDPADKRPRPARALRRRSAFAASRVPRVTVNRVNSASTVFQAGRTVFAPGCGLWFGVAWLQPDASPAPGITYRQAFDRALCLLQDNGLGGERTVGYGAFSFERDDPVRLPPAATGRPAWLLSRYRPRPDELPAALTGQATAYQLVGVAGWLRSPDGAARRRKRLHLLESGSVVSFPGHPAGDVADVNPTYENEAGDLPHPVYRYGLALAAGLQEGTHA